MNSKPPKIYFAEVHTGGSSERTALGYIPKGYEMFCNFMPVKLNHKSDDGNTFRLKCPEDGKVLPANTFVLWQNEHGSRYTFEEFFEDMQMLGYEVILLPKGINNSLSGVVAYV
jgi:hypothetical protein